MSRETTPASKSVAKPLSAIRGVAMNSTLKPHRQSSQHPGIRFRHIPVRLIIDQLKLGQAIQNRPKHDLAFRAREHCADAEVDTQTKGDVAIWLPPNVELVGIRKIRRIPIGGIDHLKDHLSLGNLFATQFRIVFIRRGWRETGLS